MLNKIQMDGPADDRKELKQLLAYNGIKAEWRGDSCRFLLSSRGVTWETECFPTGDGAVMICSFYPFAGLKNGKALEFCQSVNSQVRYGAMLLSGNRLMFRIGADLFDTYSAYETLGRALEYSAGVMVRFWVQAEKCTG